MSDWDDDDFEPEVANLAPPPPPVIETPVAPVNSAPKPVKKDVINMDLGRELTPAEIEAIQRQKDFELSREMFGCDGEDNDIKYEDIVTKEDFEEWGSKVGTYLSKRHKAAHYGDLINKLILGVSEKLEPVEIRKIAEHLKKLADSKKEEKPKTGTATANGKKKKAQLKGASKNTNNVFDDYGGGGAGKDDYDDYDDFM